MSSPPVGAYRITTYLSEDAIPPVILLNYTFFFSWEWETQNAERS